MRTNIQPSRRVFFQTVATGALGLIAGGAVIGGISDQELIGDTLILPPGMRREAKRLIPVMITPYKQDMTIDFDGVSRLTDFYMAAGAKGFFANCLSSETFYLTNAERVELTRHVVKYINGKVSVVSTGSFGKSLNEQVECTKAIHDTGVNSVILISGHFAQKADSDDTLIKNFDAFFARTGNIPLGTYECPLPYKRVLSPEVFKFLVGNERLVYHKDTCEDINKIQVKLGLIKHSKMEFYNAHTATGLASMQMGGNGMSPISANFYPEILAWLCENATNASKRTDALWIQEEIRKMEPVISKLYPISAKYFLMKRGLPIALSCRSKSQKITVEQQAILDNAYKVFLGWCDRLSITPVRV